MTDDLETERDWRVWLLVDNMAGIDRVAAAAADSTTSLAGPSLDTDLAQAASSAVLSDVSFGTIGFVEIASSTGAVEDAATASAAPSLPVVLSSEPLSSSSGGTQTPAAAEIDAEAVVHATPVPVAHVAVMTVSAQVVNEAPLEAPKVSLGEQQAASAVETTPPATYVPPAPAPVPHAAPTAAAEGVLVIAGHSAAGAVVGSQAGGDPLVYGLVVGDGPSHGTVALEADGAFTFLADAGYVGADDFQVRVEDPLGSSVVQDVSVSISADAISAAVSGGVGHGVITGSVVGVNASGDTMAYGLATGPNAGTVVINSQTGVFSYAPAAGWVGGQTDSFQVLVSDGHGGSTTQTVVVSETDAAPTDVATGASTVRGGQVVGDFTASGDVGDSLITTATAANGTVVVNANGTFTFTETDSSFVGTDTVTFTTSDGRGGDTTATAQVVVGDGANFTTGTAGGAGHGVITGSVAGSDQFGDSMAYSLATGPADGTVSLNTSSGVYTYTPTGVWVGGQTDSFSVLVSDGHGETTTQVIKVSETDVAPTTSTATASDTVYAGHSFSGAMSASDADGDTLTYSLQSPDAHVALDAVTGTFTYTAGAAGGDAFTVVASDGHGDTVAEAVSVSIGGNAVVASASGGSGQAEGTIVGSIAAADPAGDAEVYSLVGANGGAAHGTVSLDSGSSASGGSIGYVFTPDVGFVGTDSFDVLVSNGVGGTTSLAVSVDALANSPATLAADASTVRGGSVSAAFSALDPDGASMTTTATASDGTVVVNANGTFTYTETNTGFTGTDTIIFHTTDANGATTSTSATVSVGDGAVFSNGSASGAGHGAIVGSIAVSDQFGDAMGYSLVGANGGATSGTVVLNGATGGYIYTPSGSWVGGQTDSFTAQASDGHGGSTTQVITVSEANAVPVDVADGVSTVRGGQVVGSFTATDADGDALTTTATAVHGTVVINDNGSFTYTETDPNFTGTDTVSFATSDGHGGNTSATAQVVVGDGASFTTGTDGGTGHGVIVGSVAGSDQFGDTMAYSVATGPAGGGSVVINAQTGAFTYTPPSSWVGGDTDTFQVLVSDGHGGSTTQTVVVSEQNTAPTVTVSGGSGLEGSTIAGAVVGFDADGDSLSYSLVSGHGPAHGSVSLNADGTYSYSSGGFSGTDDFEVQVADGHGGTVVKDVDVSITAVTITPSASGGTGQAEGAITGSLSATDSASEAITWSLATAHTTANGVETSATAHGSVALSEATGAYTWTPDAGYVGTDSVIAVATDALGNSASESVSVVALDNAPTVSGPVSLGIAPENSSVEFSTAQLLANASDIDGGDTLSVSITGASHGTVASLGAGEYQFTPTAGYIGGAVVDFTVSDGFGDSVATTGSISVPEVFQGPVFSSGSSVSASVREATTLNGISGATDSDPNTDALVYSISGQGLYGTATITNAATGAWSYVAAPGFAGADDFVVTASDGVGHTSTQQVDLTMAATGTLSSADLNAGTVAENGSLVLTAADLLAQTSDLAGGDTITLSAGSSVHGTLAVVGDTWTFSPATNYVGAASFQVHADDGHGDVSTFDVSMQVSDQYAPVLSPTQEIASARENSVLSGSTVATDADPADPTLTYTLSSAEGQTAQHGTAGINSSTGAWTWTPDADYTASSGADSFVVNVSDGLGHTVSQTVVIDAVAPTHTLSVLGAAPLGTFDENQGVVDSYGAITVTKAQLLADISDTAGGDTLTISGLSVDHGAISDNGNSTYTITPTQGYTGSLNVSGTVADGHGDSVAFSATGTVAAWTSGPSFVNDESADPTYAIQDCSAVELAGPVAGQTTALDADAVPGLTYSITTPAGGGTATITNAATGAWSYDPGTYFGGDTFTVTATDATGQTAQQVVSMFVEGDGALTSTSNGGNWVCLGNVVTGGTYTLSTAQVLAPCSDTHGDTLTVWQVQSMNGCTVQDNGNGTWSVVQDGWSNDNPILVVAVGDQHGNTVQEFFTLTTVGNLAYVAIEGASGADATEDVSVRAVSTASGTSEASGSGLPVSYSLGSGPAHGSVAVNADGTWTFNGSGTTWTGTESFTILASDGCSSATQTIDLTVAADGALSSSGPVALGAVAAGTSLTFTKAQLLAGVTDSHGGSDTLTLTLGAATHGTITGNDNGSYTFQVANGYVGAGAGFAFSVSDGHDDSVSTTATFSALNGVSFATGSGTDGTHATQTANDRDIFTLSGTAVATDPDAGANVVYSEGTAPSHGSLVVSANGSYTYTAAGGYTGEDSFTIVATDAAAGHGGLSATQTVDVNVTPLNDLGAIGAIPLSVQAGHTVDLSAASITSAIGDAYADTLSVAGVAPFGSPEMVVGGASGGTLTSDGSGGYFYTAGAGLSGEVSFSFTVSDGHGGTAFASVDGWIYQGPSFTAGAAADSVHATQDATAFAGCSISGWTAAADLDAGAVVSYSVVSGHGPSEGALSLNATTGQWTYTATPGETGTDTFEIQASDTHGDTAVQTVVVQDQAVVLGVDGQVETGSVGAGLSGVVITSNMANGIAEVTSDGYFRVAPTTTAYGPDSFSWSGTNASGQTVGGTTTINEVSPVIETLNPSGTAQLAGITVVSSTVNLYAIDMFDGQVNTTGQYLIPRVNADGSLELILSLRDDNGNPSYGAYDLYVHTAAGAFTNGIANSTFDVTLTPWLAASDWWGQSLTDGFWGCATSPLTPQQISAMSITLQIAAGTNLAYNLGGTFQYPLAPVLDAQNPVLSGGVLANGLFVAQAGGDTLSGGTGNDTFVANGGHDVFTGAGGTDVAILQGASSAWSFVLDAAGGWDATGPGGATARLVGIDHVVFDDGTTHQLALAPVAGTTAVSTNEGTAATGTLAATDANGNPLSFAEASGPSHGTLTIGANGAYDYTPTAGFSGTDSFTYTVSDGDGHSATQAVAVTVVQPDVVSALNAHITNASDHVSGFVSATSSDSLAIAYSTAAGPSHGTFTLDPTTGAYSYVADAGYTGADTVSWTATDGQASTTKTLTFNDVAAPAASISLSGGLAPAAVLLSDLNVNVAQLFSDTGGVITSAATIWLGITYSAHGSNDIGIALDIRPNGTDTEAFRYSGWISGDAQQWWGLLNTSVSFDLHLTNYWSNNGSLNPFGGVSDNSGDGSGSVGGTIAVTLQAGYNFDAYDFQNGIGVNYMWSNNAALTGDYTWGNMPNTGDGMLWIGTDGTISVAAPIVGSASGNDTLYGTGESDTIQGIGAGNTLVGGVGTDTMIGGSGQDTFVLSTAGKALVEDFTVAKADVLEIVGFDAAELTASDQSDGLHIQDLATGQDLGILEGVHASNINGSGTAAAALSYLISDGQIVFADNLSSEIVGQTSYATATAAHGGMLFGGDLGQDPLTFTLTGNNGGLVESTAHGTVTLLADGAYTYQCTDTHFYGQDTFQITATDSSGHAITETIVQNVLPNMSIPDLTTTECNNAGYGADIGSDPLANHVKIAAVDAFVPADDGTGGNWINVGVSGGSTAQVALDMRNNVTGNYHFQGSLTDATDIQNGIVLHDISVVLTDTLTGGGWSAEAGTITVEILAGTNLNTCYSGSHDGNGWYNIGLTPVAGGQPQDLVSNNGTGLAFSVANGASVAGTGGNDTFQGTGAAGTVTMTGSNETAIVSAGHELSITNFSLAGHDDLVIHGFTSQQVTFVNEADGTHVEAGGADLAVLVAMHPADFVGCTTGADMHSYFDAHGAIHYS